MSLTFDYETASLTDLHQRLEAWIGAVSALDDHVTALAARVAKLEAKRGRVHAQVVEREQRIVDLLEQVPAGMPMSLAAIIAALGGGEDDYKAFHASLAQLVKADRIARVDLPGTRTPHYTKAVAQ